MRLKKAEGSSPLFFWVPGWPEILLYIRLSDKIPRFRVLSKIRVNRSADPELANNGLSAAVILTLRAKTTRFWYRGCLTELGWCLYVKNLQNSFAYRKNTLKRLGFGLRR